MVNLLNLNALNYEEALSFCKNTDKKDVINIFKDCFLYAPHKVDSISRLIVDLCHDNSSFIQDIKDLTKLTCSSVKTYVSFLIYCKSLNCKVSQIKVKVVENDFFKDEKIEIVNEVEVNEFLNDLEIFIDNIRMNLDEDIKNNLVNFNEISFFKIISIIENYQFDIYECLDVLHKEYSTYEIFIGILFLINNSSINSFYLINLYLRSIYNEENSKILLKIFPIMKKDTRDRLIAFIYEWFINRRKFKNLHEENIPFETPEEILELKKFIDKDTVEELRKFLSLQSLELFIPEFKSIYEVGSINSIKKEDLDFNKNKKDFYRDFCLLGSPSVSHFLSYLEIYKNEMKMDEEQQKIFLEIFCEIFSNRTSFKKIVIDKMVKFNFIKSELLLK